MTLSNKLKELAVQLFEIDAVKFGEFMTKSGVTTPVYFDLRVIVSYPHVMESITTLLYETSVKQCQYDHLCGVPYTALPVATLLSVKAQKPMLMRRKEAKAYGTKKMIEGHYKNGEKCLIIEDVVTSGSSVLETVTDLRKEGLLANQCVVILNREQGGVENLKQNGVEMTALFTLTQLVQVLIDEGKIEKSILDNVKKYLKGTQILLKAPEVKEDRTKMPYEKRANIAKNAIAKKLFTIMSTKKTNLCLSVDLTSTAAILNLLEKVGPYICMVKTHADIIDDFTLAFVENLRHLAKRDNFIILEDRKFADIGNTVSLQYGKGLFRIAEWADAVTVHSLPGDGVLKGIKATQGLSDKGVFLLAEMSSQGNLITSEYKDATVKMASEHSDLVMGLVSQSKELLQDPGLIQLTPGVQLEATTDGLGQLYNSPESVMLERGADVAVVGRGILTARNPAAQAQLYRDALWDNYLKRITSD